MNTQEQIRRQNQAINADTDLYREQKRQAQTTIEEASADFNRKKELQPAWVLKESDLSAQQKAQLSRPCGPMSKYTSNSPQCIWANNPTISNGPSTWWKMPTWIIASLTKTFAPHPRVGARLPAANSGGPPQ
jgi:hypothetical protein